MITAAGKWDEKEHPRDSEGKFTESGFNVVKKVALGKPLKINTAVIYKQKYEHGGVVAEHPGTSGQAKRLTWNATTKKFDLQVNANGTWFTTESYGKDAAYKKFSKETGWLTPTSFEESSTTAPSLKSLAAKYVAPTTPSASVTSSLTKVSGEQALIAITEKTKTTKPGDVIAVRSPASHRMIKGDENPIEITLQKYDKSSGTWEPVQHFFDVNLGGKHGNFTLVNFIQQNQNWNWEMEPKAALTPAAPSTSSITAKPDLASSLTTPMQLNTKAIYTTKYGHGAVVGYRKMPDGSLQRLAWHEDLKRFILQQRNSDGTWQNINNFTKSDAYKTFAKQADWFAPPKGDAATGSPSFTGSSTKVGVSYLPATKPAATSVSAASVAGVAIDFKDTSGPDKTSLVYDHGKLIGYATDSPGGSYFYALDADGKKPKYPSLAANPGESIVAEITKSKFASKIKKVPASPTTPAVPKPTKPEKFDAAQLQALHGTPPSLNNMQLSYLYSSFKFGKAGGNPVTLKSQPSNVFKRLLSAMQAYNKAYGKGSPQGEINLLQAVRLIDERATFTSGNNQHLYEKKLVEWLQTPSGKTTATNALLGDAAPKKPPKPGTGIKHWSEIGTPKTGVTTFNMISPSAAQAMQDDILHSAPWTEAQRKALTSYTGTAYQNINKKLRAGEGATPTAKNIQAAMRPLTRSVTVYRSTVKAQFPGLSNYSTFDQVKAFEGKVITDKGFVSTSVNPRGGSVELEIDLPEGTPAAYVQSISKYPIEHEMLLAAGLNYRVISVTKVSGYGDALKVKMQVVP